MAGIKKFDEFINEIYLDKLPDPEILDNNKKEMKKNGYIEVKVIEPIEGIEKDTKVLVSSTEFGELDDESMLTCYKDDEKFMIPKKNVQMEV